MTKIADATISEIRLLLTEMRETLDAAGRNLPSIELESMLHRISLGIDFLATRGTIDGSNNMTVARVVALEPYVNDTKILVGNIEFWATNVPPTEADLVHFGKLRRDMGRLADRLIVAYSHLKGEVRSNDRALADRTLAERVSRKVAYIVNPGVRVAAALRHDIVEMTPSQELAPFQYEMTETGLSVLPLRSATEGNATRYAAAQRGHLLDVAAHIAESLAGSNCSPQLRWAFTSIAAKLKDEGAILLLGQSVWTSQQVFEAEEDSLMNPLAALLRSHLLGLEQYLAQFDDWRDFVSSSVDVSVSEENEKAISDDLAALSRELSIIEAVDKAVVDSLDEAAQWPILRTKWRGGRIQAKVRTLGNLVSAALRSLGREALDQGRQGIALAIIGAISVGALTGILNIPGFQWLPGALRAAKALLGMG
ncbi:hypothetical protein [Rhizobium herbae]